jgi:hypothetical protein
MRQSFFNLKQKCIRLANRLLPARDVIREFSDWAEADDHSRAITDRGWHHWSLPVREREVIELAPAIPIDGEANPVFEGGRLYRYPPLQVAHIRDGELIGRDSVVLSPDGRIFEEFTHGWGIGGAALPRVPRLGLPPAQEKRGLLATILSPGSATPNYFHWLVETLPRIAVMEQSGLRHFQLIVPAERMSWQTESLEMLGYSADRRVEFDGGHWCVSSLLVPSLMGFSGMSRPWAVKWLRKKFCGGSNALLKNRIYISRARTGYRRVRNEDAVRQLLEANGFQTVYAETLSFSEQCSLFSNAEWIVSIHGAGLTNVLFAPAGCRVLEFMTPVREYINACYYALSAACGHHYMYLMGRPVGAMDSAQMGRWRQDLEIPLDLLTRVLQP